ncbi:MULTISPECIES: CLC_0170 family protein [unclassified Paenibacillus]|uniref:CLC_0170 family protein n=1 Tax=unclassified Paenibacillus TaxID=185978 RepID=UPI000B09E4D9|nr:MULTISPECIES: CLC_0170 family protein [unclassified Paenibacillus]
MVSLFSSSAAIAMFSALMLLTVDRNIYKSSGWVREKKYASALGWCFAGIALIVVVWRIMMI